MGDIKFSENNTHFRFRESTVTDCKKQLFDTNWLASSGSLRSVNLRGRGRVDIFEYGNKLYLVRPYLRGGLMAKALRDRYLWTGLERSRPWQEFSILEKMKSMDLACPAPYACKVERHGLFYTGALITRFITDSETLAEILCRREVKEEEWFAIGRCIRKFHDAGVAHSDLNANNILLSGGDIHIIDFDKASIRSNHDSRLGTAWKYQSLKRLRRSLMKCWSKADTFNFSPASWEHLNAGYVVGPS